MMKEIEFIIIFNVLVLELETDTLYHIIILAL